MFKAICDNICDEPFNISNIIDLRRLGKKASDANDVKPRPLVVKPKDQSLKRPILTNANKLRSLEDSLMKNIRMGHDLTKSERENSKQLYNEAKQKQNKDTSPG